MEGNDRDGLTQAGSGTAPGGSVNAIHGKHLAAEFGASPTAFTDITGWTMTMTVGTSDATPAHPTECGRLRLAGIKTASATVTILTPATVLPVLEGVTGALNLARSATIGDGQYEGNAICTGSESGVDVNGTEITTLSFIYTGAVTLETT